MPSQSISEVRKDFAAHSDPAQARNDRGRLTVNRSLTAKQAAFACEYLVDMNATQAAIRAGYSLKTAASQGERLLRNVEVRQAIDAGLSSRATKTGVTAERVLRERARLAFFDPRKLLDKNGVPIPLEKLDDDTAAAIAGIDVMQLGADVETGAAAVVKKYRLVSKDPSLAALEKYLGLNEKPIRFPLPEVATAEDCARAQGDIVRGAAGGELLPSEAETLGRLVENQRRSLETMDLARRLAALEEQLAQKGFAP